MDDANIAWSETADWAARKIEELRDDVGRLNHVIDDLAHMLRDKGAMRFDDKVEDYTILTFAQDLRSAVDSGFSSVQRKIHTAANEVEYVTNGAQRIGTIRR